MTHRTHFRTKLLLGKVLLGLTSVAGMLCVSQAARAVTYRQLTGVNNAGDNSPCWSPDGTRVYYSSRATGLPYIFYKSASDAANVPGTRITQWFFDENSVTLSPDGAWALIEVQDSTVTHLWKVPANGGSPQTKLAPGPFYHYAPDWWGQSGNEWIAFATTRGGAGTQIWIMRPDGSQMSAVTGPGYQDFSPAFSPDGQSIAFHSNRSGSNPEIFKVTRQGPGWSTPVQLTSGSDGRYNPCWSPDGQRMAYQEFKQGQGQQGIDVSVWLAHADGTNPQKVADQGTFDGDPAWSPSGAEIAFASNRSGATYIWVGSDILTPTVPSSWGWLKARYGP